MRSSSDMGEELRSAANLESCSVISLTTENFEEEWNKTRSEYVIIHTHGGPNGIYDVINEDNTQDTLFLKTSISKLKKNNRIKCVIITSCSVASYAGFLTDNFASALSRKINSKGVVVGCRYTVQSDGISFWPVSDYSINLPQPWMIYRNGLVIDRDLPAVITMTSLYNYLFSKGYVD